MAQYLKRWESPRRRGRNDKGKGGAARARQLRKRDKQLSRKLKSNRDINRTSGGKDNGSFPPFVSDYF